MATILLIPAYIATIHAADYAWSVYTSSKNPNDSSFERRVEWNGVKSWFRGTKALSVEQERRGHNLLGEYNSQESGATPEFTDDDLFDVELDEDGKVTRKKIRRRMHKPFVHRVVRHCRGELGQREHTPSNVMVVERVARAYCHEHNVRSSDISCVLPVMIALYFFSRSEIQIEAEAIQQSMAFVESTKPHRFAGVGGRQHSGAGA
uniref:Replicase n=1 Tax=Actinidia yellowing virus 2 TaxID=2715796 RepID=A0A8B6MVE1_9VIRU|nr:replicase [Actinidia yellowing virus 2]